MKIPYGLKNGKLVHISEVESGAACQCICPTCNAPLVARKGSIKIHHFAHLNSPECEWAGETTLHLLTKEILSQQKTIFIPGYGIEFLSFFTRSGRSVYFRRVYRASGKDEKIEVKIDEVALETRLGRIAPDIVIFSAGEPLLLEIYVTHRVGREKLRIIEQNGWPAIEVDLHRLRHFPDRQELAKILTNPVRMMNWLNNPMPEQIWVTMASMADQRAVNFNDSLNDWVVMGCPLQENNTTCLKHIKWGLALNCRYCLYFLSTSNRDNPQQETKFVYCLHRAGIATYKDFFNRFRCLPKRI